MNRTRPDVAEYVAALKGSERFGRTVVAHRAEQAVGSQTLPLPAGLAPALSRMLEQREIDRLYTHQSRAIEHILNREDILVATPTASGKSLIYNLPVLNALIRDPGAKALYIFPLKALARDQVRTIREMAKALPDLFSSALDPVAVYDGDTPAYRRKKIRDHPPGILVTNPDMLHQSMLPYHNLWPGLFANLTHVVIDEVHTYRGVFGSHMAWVIRRLKRICRLYGSDPVFVLSSATVGNPAELGRSLLGTAVTAITASGAPKGPRNTILLNPLDSAPYTATLLLEAAVRRGLRVIVYTRSRKMTELITMWTGKRIGNLRDRIASYRAGFLPEDRRRIEARLTDGRLLGVISTSALELGIDIGSLDICILVGYPGSIMATRQRGGRVGRAGRESLVVLIGQEDALDQHFMRNPDDFFCREVEAVVLNPANPAIARQHLVCAAAETPLTSDEALCRDPAVSRILTRLTEAGGLLNSADGATWFSHHTYPHRHVHLRGSGDRYLIREHNSRKVIGEIDGFRALRECHPGAVYLHRASPFLIEALHMEGHEIVARPFSGPYYTRVISDKSTKILETVATRSAGATRIHFGRLRVTETISSFEKILTGSGKTIGRSPLDLPPRIFETEGFWLEIPRHIRQNIEQRQLHFMGGIHALEHAMIALLPLLVLCDRDDIGGISYPWYEELEHPAVFVYDGHSGGVGLCARAFSDMDKLLSQTLNAVRQCPCELGCPSCVHSPKCGSGNRPIDKKSCEVLLSGLLRPGDRTGPDDQSVRPGRNTQGKRSAKQASSPLPERFGVFDLETQRSAHEVGGWHRAKKMGISVGVVYDGRTDRFHHYREDEVGGLVDHLFSLELVIGFNNKRFDNQVLSAYTDMPPGRLPALDILEEIHSRLGYRLSLDRLAEHTLEVKKEGNGLLALQWYKEGQLDRLARYCEKDVEITRDLFLFGLREGFLLFRAKSGQVVRLPVDFSSAIARVLQKN